MQAVDVAAIMDGLARENPQRLDWRHSIVDLMKLLGLDSSQTARRELAQELHYSGDPSDSAAMNMWLHRQVMQKLAENGGKVPEDLRR
jgi:DNA-binding LacI/PurR family transcriptional regulator